MNCKHPFQYRIGIRFKDIDAMGHVNNAVIFTYFEEGRKALFCDSLKKPAPRGFNFILAHMECDYILPVRLEDRVLLNMWVTTIGTKSFGLAYALMNEADTNLTFAKGSSVQVCYDYRRGQPIPVPEALKNALLAYHLPS